MQDSISSWRPPLGNRTLSLRTRPRRLTYKKYKLTSRLGGKGLRFRRGIDVWN